MSRRLPLFLLCLVLPLTSLATDAPARQLAVELLGMAGTAAVLEGAPGQAALADPAPFLGDSGHARRERLLQEAGLRSWRPPRVWLLQARVEGEAERWQSAASPHMAGAVARGYALVDVAPLPAAEQAIALLATGSAVPPGLATLLQAYGADVLVLQRGEEWSLWTPRQTLRGRLPARQAELLPQVLAEAMASLQQWPEAPGQPVVEVAGIADLAGQAGAQRALQGLPEVRQVRLIRVDGGRAWFALVGLEGQALADALDAEPRLPAPEWARLASRVPAGTLEARSLACPLQRRVWRPEAAPSLPETPVDAVQSFPPSR